MYAWDARLQRVHCTLGEPSAFLQRNALSRRGIPGTVLTLSVNPRPGRRFWLVIRHHSNRPIYGGIYSTTFRRTGFKRRGSLFHLFWFGNRRAHKKSCPRKRSEHTHVTKLVNQQSGTPVKETGNQEKNISRGGFARNGTIQHGQLTYLTSPSSRDSCSFVCWGRRRPIDSSIFR